MTVSDRCDRTVAQVWLRFCRAVTRVVGERFGRFVKDFASLLVND